ncbi:MAG: DUF2793 domain-containing protein [Hyphomicrobiales bacterium]|nr:DUF2793 domain-containing protein [Hyphomicrobiales bacterium]MDE2113796.1 DUF2793 domain-containing protein [Hyphomicrobiales bacterium]
MSQTDHLGLPFIDAAQAQKHITHNDGLNLLDILVHLSVAERGVTAPPPGPVEGLRLLLGTGATGSFAGHDGTIAAFQDGAWRFVSPVAGWRLYCEAESAFLLFNGSVWSDLAASLKNLQNIANLGIGTTANAQNPLAVALNSALFTALAPANGGSGDLRMVLNKSGAANTVSQLYQDNYSGRAETGLAGNDHFHIKVSADGNVWREAINIDPATGFVGFPSGATHSWVNRVINGNFAINQRGYVSGAALAAGAYAHDRWRAGAAGASYTFTQGQSDTQINITSGSLQQIVEGAMFEGGTFTLSWAGTSLGSINGGTPSPSPITVAALAAGANVTLEFAVGTLGLAQWETGTLASPMARRSLTSEQMLCWRYFYNPPYLGGNYMFVVGNSEPWRGILVELPVEMRVTPTIQGGLYSNGSANFTVESVTSKQVRIRGDVSGTGVGIFSEITSFSANAEI